MYFLPVVFAALVLGPLVGIATVVADARSGGRALTSRHIVMAAAWGGGIFATPAACVLAITPHGAVSGIPLLLGAGAAYGAAIGSLVLGARRLLVRARDRTA